MRGLKMFALLWALGLGIAHGAEVKVDHDPDADFSAFEEFAWKSTEQVLANPLAEKRVRTALLSELNGKGYELVDVEEADFVVDFRVTVSRDVRVDETWWGWGGRRVGRRGRWVRQIDVTTYPVGTLAVVITNADTGTAIWRGVASGAIASDTRANEKKINKAAAKLFRKFPPR